MAKKRLPRMKEDTLIVAYGYSVEGGEDMHFINGPGTHRSDGHLLHRYFDCEWRGYDNKVTPSLIDELKSRGYDISTLRFSIRKL
jgi:hypothetical protein